jgi:signal transduction histidine kinase
VHEHREQGGPPVEFTHDLGTDRLAAPVETAVFRIVQEALANVRRHSRSDRASVDVALQNGRLRVEVRDRGVGFEPGSVRENCFGLRGIRERAKLLGGTVKIESTRGEGTRIHVTLPLVARPPDQG